MNKMREKLNYIIDELMENGKTFVVWGCGNTGVETIQYIKTYSDGKIEPAYVVDNNSSKWGKNNVVGPAQFCENMNGVECVLVCVYVADQVVKQLKEWGYSGQVEIIVSSIMNIDDETIKYYQCNMDKIDAMKSLLVDERSVRTVDAFLEVINTGDIEKWDLVNGVSDNKLVDNTVIDIGRQETFVDVGAFTGDTLATFLKHSNNMYSSVLCIEADKCNYDLLVENIAKSGLKNIIAINVGAGRYNTKKKFSSERSESCVFSDGGNEEIEVVCLDELEAARETSILKISTNGFDLDVLLGAEKILKRNRPQIAVYASGSQLWEIPMYLKAIVPEYKILYRHYGYGRQAMICYAKL